MASEFACPQCKSVEWVRREVIQLDSQSRAVGARDSGVWQCGGCACRITIDERGAVTRVETSAKKTLPGSTRLRVQSDAIEHEGRIEPRRF